MNYYLIKEYLKKLLSDDLGVCYLKVYFLTLFWFLIPLVAIIIVLTVFILIGIQLEFINNQMMALPWDKLPVSNEVRSLIMNLTFALVFVLLLTIELKFVEQLVNVVKKKLRMNTNGEPYEK
jgi:hypothetical protein